MTRRRKCRECGRLMSPNRSAPVCPRCVAERKKPVVIEEEQWLSATLTPGFKPN